MVQMTDIREIEARIPLSMDAIQAFCKKYQVTEFSLFGSVLRADFRAQDSDVDVVVVFDPDAHPSLLTIGAMEIELEELFGRDVDVLTRRGVEQMENESRRQHILESARVIYAR
jgi:hypothetical protein